jgi:hypothetical protein
MPLSVLDWPEVWPSSQALSKASDETAIRRNPTRPGRRTPPVSGNAIEEK